MNNVITGNPSSVMPSLVGDEGFTFVPELSSVKPSRNGVSMWHHVLGVHSDRIPFVLGVASSGDAPRSYLPPRVQYVGFACDLEQAFNLLACSLRAPDGTGWFSFDHLARSELTSADWETLVIHTERLEGSWQGENAEGWRRLLECGPTFLFNVLRLSVGPDGHFMSVLLGVFHALSSQRVTFGIQGLFGSGKSYCASAALILLTQVLGLKALFVAEPNLPLQEFLRNVQSLRRSCVSFRACLGGTMTKPQTLMSLMRLALNSSRTMSPAVWPLLSAPFSTK